MEFQINLDPEQINKNITEAVAKSAIGKELQRAIEKAVKDLSQSYNNPFEHIIKMEIEKLIREEVTKHLDHIRDEVAKRLTTEVLNDIVSKSLTSLLNTW